MNDLWPTACDGLAERYEVVVEEIELQRRFTRRSVIDGLVGRIAYPWSSTTVVVAELRRRGLIRLVSHPAVRPQTFVCT